MSLGCSFKVCGVQYGTYVVRQCVPRWGKPRSMNVLCTLTRDNNADRRLERARLETCLVFTDCVIRMSNEWKKLFLRFIRVVIIIDSAAVRSSFSPVKCHTSHVTGDPAYLPTFLRSSSSITHSALPKSLGFLQVQLNCILPKMQCFKYNFILYHRDVHIRRQNKQDCNQLCMRWTGIMNSPDQQQSSRCEFRTMDSWRLQHIALV